MAPIAWNWNPAVLLGLVFTVGAYLAAAQRFGARGRQVLPFLVGVALVFFALSSPLSRAANLYLLSLHLAQQTLMQVVAAPLLVVGLPHGALAALRRHPAGARLMGWSWSAIPAAILYNAVLALWHVPSPDAGPGLACAIGPELALRRPWVARVQDLLPPGAGDWQDLLPLGAGILFWGAMLLPEPFTGDSRGVRLAVLGGSWVFNWLLGLVHPAAGPALYSYSDAARLLGLGPVIEQVLRVGAVWQHATMLNGLALVAALVWEFLGELLHAPGGSGLQAAREAGLR